MSETLIQLNNISLSYADKTVFSHFNLSIPKGKIIAVLGPSGCGKTSFLRLLSRLILADEGQIIFNGTDISKIPERKMQLIRRQMGFMFQSNALYTDLNVFDNIAYPIRVHSNLSEDLVRTVTLMKLQMVGLRGASNKMPHELSGGMARRIALARSLALDPCLMLYDEPFTGQDPIGMQVLLSLVKRFHDCLKMTSIIVSHDVDEVCQIADHVILFEAGQVLAQGSPLDLINSRDTKVSQFMMGKLEGDMPFHYPATPYNKDLLYDTIAP